MAVLWQALGTIDGAANAGAAPSMPTHVTGDIIFIVVESANENVGAVTPTGYTAVTTAVGTGTAAGTAATRASVWWKRAASSGETTPSLGDYGDHTIAVIFTVRGAVVSGSPINIAATAVDAAATTAGSCPGATTTVTDALVINVMTNAIDATTAVIPGAVTNANLTGLTKRFDAGNISGNGGGIAIISGSKATAGATGATTFTTTSSVHSYMTFAVAPDTTAPTITSTNSASVAENAVLSKSLTADETVTWSIRTTGQDATSLDAAQFELSGTTLRWLSNGTKDFEAPNDSNTNNVYVVVVRATDINGNTTDQTISVTVTDVVNPSITSSATAAVNENVALAHSLTTASGSPTWSIVGGADQAKFELSGATLRWVGNGTKNYEAPDDANTDNVYLVTVRATVTPEFADQAISVTVLDVLESPRRKPRFVQWF